MSVPKCSCCKNKIKHKEGLQNVKYVLRNKNDIPICVAVICNNCYSSESTLGVEKQRISEKIEDLDYYLEAIKKRRDELMFDKLQEMKK